jgi:hypothetical protein
LHSNKKYVGLAEKNCDLLLFSNRIIFCQIPAKYCTISPQNQIFFCPILAKFCGEMAKKKSAKFSQNFLPKTHTFFYLPHIEYEGSIGLVSRKMKKKYC